MILILNQSLNNVLIAFNFLKRIVRPGSFIIVGMIMLLCWLFYLSIGFDAVGYSPY